MRQACRHSACLVGICQASHAAAKMAETVAEEEVRHQGCRGSLSGLRSWLWAPTQCQLWAKALRKAWAFGFRMSMALTTTSLFFALAKPNQIWPHSNGPLWTLVTVVLILTPVQGASLQRALRRMAGTAVGSAAALGSVFLIDASGGRPELAVLSTHIFILSFALKFFEQELQYAGAVTFVTFTVIIFSLSDELYDNTKLDLKGSALRLALRRCCDVAVGVIISTAA